MEFETEEAGLHFTPPCLYLAYNIRAGNSEVQVSVRI